MDRTEMQTESQNDSVSLKLKMLLDVPNELKKLKQWVCWRSVERDGRITKMPVNAMTGKPAKSNDPTTWTDFESACDGAVGLGASGVGFCFSETDGLVGIDLDACIDAKGKIADWALDILGSFKSYAEISPSGRGLKMWCRGTIPKGYKVNLGEKDEEIGKAPGIEVYTTGRYFAVTGERWEGSRHEIVSCKSQIDWLLEKYWPATPEPTLDPQRTYTQATSGQSLPAQERAAKYLDKLPPTECGTSSCHDKTFRAACICVLGFAMTPEQARGPLEYWCSKGGHNWNETELTHKLNQANKQGGERGFLLTGKSYDDPSVDLSQFMKQFEQPTATAVVLAEPEELTPADIVPSPENFPQEAMKPPGFIGDMIQHTLDTSMYPIPELALAAHLALMSTLCGQKIADANFRTRPNCYFVGLMPSGGGKDHARMIIKDLLREAGIPELEGEENFASSASIWSAADEQPVGIYMLDEMASLLATTHDAKGSPHLYKVTDTFLRLFSSVSVR
jgi:hypothetical protein